MWHWTPLNKRKALVESIPRTVLRLIIKCIIHLMCSSSVGKLLRRWFASKQKQKNNKARKRTLLRSQNFDVLMYGQLRRWWYMNIGRIHAAIIRNDGNSTTRMENIYPRFSKSIFQSIFISLTSDFFHYVSKSLELVMPVLLVAKCVYFPQIENRQSWHETHLQEELPVRKVWLWWAEIAAHVS